MDCVLRLGEGVVVRLCWLSRWRIIFAGGVSSDVFSLAVEWSQVHNSASYNIYFRKSQREFSVVGGRVTVQSVSPDEIRFLFDRRTTGGEPR